VIQGKESSKEKRRRRKEESRELKRGSLGTTVSTRKRKAGSAPQQNAVERKFEHYKIRRECTGGGGPGEKVERKKNKQMSRVRLKKLVEKKVKFPEKVERRDPNTGI